MPYRNRVQRISILLDSNFREICCKHYDWLIAELLYNIRVRYEMMRVDTSYTICWALMRLGQYRQVTGFVAILLPV